MHPKPYTLNPFQGRNSALEREMGLMELELARLRGDLARLTEQVRLCMSGTHTFSHTFSLTLSLSHTLSKTHTLSHALSHTISFLHPLIHTQTRACGGPRASHRAG